MQVALNTAAADRSADAIPPKYEFHRDIERIAEWLGTRLRQNINSQTHTVNGIPVEFAPINAVKLGAITLGSQLDDDSVVLTLSARGWQCGGITGARLSELRNEIPRRLRAVYERMLG